MEMIGSLHANKIIKSIRRGDSIKSLAKNMNNLNLGQAPLLGFFFCFKKYQLKFPLEKRLTIS